MRPPLVLAALLALPVAAVAQDRPPMSPTRDATIDYRVEGANGGPRTMRMFLAAGGKLMRIEMPGQPGSMIMDRNASRMMIVMADARRYLERPLSFDQQTGFDFDRGQGFTRKGTETIAGLRCTVWESTGEHAGTGCVTDDGLVLRGESASPDGMRSRLVATAVKVAPLGADTFRPPAGFAKMEMPAGMPGGMPPRARPGARP